ncbi:hypothetical protein U5801_04745 [Lamprobacter modestohalophilus]|uniref:hypothetical protein n=1 Tax=Lamprobacter modestohalophilus TaxID=1064514 RepID=UPI002ADEB1CD|nr:hypothetical protein [Lamprobacter modestohalophilus]MEA1049119.1 hypothetical protein [Lamprobacter modestohalophilus]
MYNEQIQTQLLSHEPSCSERSKRMQGALTEMTLRHENALYAKTRGISQSNRSCGWRPGYLNRTTGEFELSRFSDGRPAPIHVLDGLPESWVQGRDAEGHVVAAEPEIISGFIRDGRFFTREQTARAAAH